MNNKLNNLYEFDEFQLDTKERVLLRGGETIILAAKVFDTLEMLVEHQGKIVSKDELMNKVWADTFVEENNLSQNIYLLRKTLGKDFIETVPRRGYRFSKDVRLLEKENGHSFNEENDFFIAQRTKTSAYIKEEVFEEDTETKKTSETKIIPAKSKEDLPFGFKKFYMGIAAGTAAVVLIGFLGVFLWQQNASNAENAVIQNIKLEKLTDEGDIHSFAISPDGQFLAIINKTNSTENQFFIKDLSSNKAIPIDVPKTYSPQSIEFSQDGKSLYFLHRPAKAKGAEIYKTSRFGGETELVTDNVWSNFSVSPNGEEIAFYRLRREKNQSRLVIFNLVEKKERVVVTRNFPERYEEKSFPTWSADGTKFYAIIKPQIEALSKLSEIDIETGEEKVIETPKFSQFVAVKALPNGEDLVLTARERRRFPQVYKMKITGENIQRLTNDLNVYRRLSLSKDGKKLIVLQKNTFSHIWSLPESSIEKASKLTDGRNSRHGRHGLDILPDGRIVYTSLDDFTRGVWTINPKDGSKQHFTKDYGVVNERPKVSGDGNYIYFSSAKGKVKNINRISVYGGEIETIVGSKTGSELFPNTSPDGQTLYFIRRSKGKSAIYKKDLSDGKETEIEIPENFSVDSFLTISPDGRFLAFRLADRQKRYIFEESESNPVDVGIISIGDKNFKPKTLNLITSQSQFRWSKTSDAIHFIKHEAENSAIWKQEVFADVEPQKVIELKDTKIFHFKFADNGDLVVSKGKHLDDTVLLTNFD